MHDVIFHCISYYYTAVTFVLMHTCNSGTRCFLIVDSLSSAQVVSEFMESMRVVSDDCDPCI